MLLGDMDLKPVLGAMVLVLVVLLRFTAVIRLIMAKLSQLPNHMEVVRPRLHVAVVGTPDVRLPLAPLDQVGTQIEKLP